MKVTLSLKADPADAVHVSFASAAAETSSGSVANVSILVLGIRTADFLSRHDAISLLIISHVKQQLVSERD